MREVGGIVDIQGDAGQVQYRRRNPARLGGGEMREETVLAKAQLHRIGRRHQDRVRAALVMRRDDREGRRRAVRGNNPADLRCRHERDVTRQRQHAASPLAGEPPRRRSNRAGMAVIGTFGHAGAIVPDGENQRRRVGRDEKAAIEAINLGQRRQHIFEHREGKRLAQIFRQDRGKPLFCGRCVLDRDHRPDPLLSPAHLRCSAMLRPSRRRFAPPQDDVDL